MGGFKHVLPGFSFDITVNDPMDNQPWDFCLKSKRERARRLLREQAPYFLIGSPMCKHFCTWQALNEARSSDPDKMRRAKTQARLHLSFVAQLYRDQLDAGRYVLHEHPE